MRHSTWEDEGDYGHYRARQVLLDPEYGRMYQESPQDVRQVFQKGLRQGHLAWIEYNWAWEDALCR